MSAGRINVQHLALGLFLLSVAALLATGAARIPVDKGYAILGPQVFPFTVSAFLGIVAALLCWQSATGGYRHLADEEAEPPTRERWLGAAWLSAGILAVALLIGVLGFVLSAALLFVCAARGFGSRQPLRDLAVGIALTLPVFWLFTKALGLSLPALVSSWL